MKRTIRHFNKQLADADLHELLRIAAFTALQTGTDADGEKLKPLAMMYGVKYPDRKAKTGRQARAIIRWGHRAGGQPLMDTRTHIHNRISAKTVLGNYGTELKLVLTIPEIAAYHLRGFKTKGPNFIPLTRAAMRRHQRGANPETEGLVQGWDYKIAMKGVTVPARPFFSLDSEWMINDIVWAIQSVITGNPIVRL